MELISDELQSIEHDLKEVDDYNKHIDGLASEKEEEHIEDIAGINKERYN